MLIAADSSSRPPATGDVSSPQSSASIFPAPPSEMEAKFYYGYLPSAPRLVARTSTAPWQEPTGTERTRKSKELHVVGNHAIQEAWEGELTSKVFALLESMDVNWTSIDVVRIGYKDAQLPVILWIGVVPASRSGTDGVVVAYKCREILLEHNITDVDVEIRESVVEFWGARAALEKLTH